MVQADRVNARFSALIFAGTILLFLPTWLWLADAWLSDPYYSHGPLVLLVALYFFWTQRKFITESRAVISRERSDREISFPESNDEISRYARNDRESNLSFLLVVVALAVHLWAIVWRAYYISALMIPVALLGLLVALYGWQIARRFLFPLAFLVLMVPVPLVERLGPVLEEWTATAATSFAQFIGVAARNEGSQVFLPNSTFTVGIPCGGLRSVIAIITLVTLWAYIVAGAWWARGIVLLAAIPIALAANTLRLAILFAIANTWGAQVGLDYFHSWSSPALFLLAFALLLALAKLVGASNVRWEVVAPS